MADLDNYLVTFASLKETVTRLNEYANQFEPRKEVISKAKLTYSTNYIRAYCDYVATIPATVRVTDDDGSVLLVTGSANGSWRAVRLIKGETDRFHKVYYSNGYVYIQVDNDSMYTVFGGVQLKVFGSATGTEITIENAADADIEIPTSYPANAISYVNETVGSATVDDALNTVIAELHTHDNKEVLDLLSESDTGKLQYNGVTIYDDTEVKSDIASLNTDKQDKTDNTLDTTDKTVTGAINEVNGNLLDTVGFSDDYKSIILNRKSGLNPYTIPISAIINNTSLSELKDIDSTNIGDGKTLVYDSSTQKHKYVNTTGTDEFVKMDSTTDANYLSNLIDKSTIVNDNGVLKVKKLDGQEVTITEINYLKGLTMNVMDLVNAFANGGVKVWETPVNTYSDLETLDRSTFTDGISYIVYVLIDETHSNAKTTYLCTKTSTTFFGNADSQRNFTTNPIDLANEVTGKLGTSNIDVDNLWTLLTINDTYKTLTTNNEIFGTHGAKAMYDELVTAIGKKANTSDMPTKVSELTNDAGYISEVINTLTSADTDKPLSANQGKVLKDELGLKANASEVVKKTDITNTIDINSSDMKIPNVKAIYNDIIEGKVVDQTAIDKYGTEILKYPLGIWRINNNDISNNFSDLPVKISGRIEITSIDSATNKNPWNNNWSYRTYNFETFNKMNYFRKITSGNEVGVKTDTGWQEIATMDSVPESVSNPAELDTNKFNKNGYYSIGDATKRTNLPVQKVGTLLVYYAGYYVIQEYILNENLRTFIRRSIDNGANWSAWRELATTNKVADIDVPKTTLTPEFPGEARVASGGVAINYVVKNGWCNVNFEFNLASATTFTWTRIASGLPKPANNVNILLMDESGKVNRTIAIKINSTGSVSSRIPVQFTAVDWWTGNISYPVAE